MILRLDLGDGRIRNARRFTVREGGGHKGKMQFGSAWWLLDHKKGMLNQFESLAANGLISCFVSMVTDSRSFLSFSRHEYFRRLLCDYFAKLIQSKEYPDKPEFVGKIIQDICYNNIKNYMLS